MGFYKITRLANIFTNLFSSKKISKIILFIVLFGVICLLFSSKVLAYNNEVSNLEVLENAGFSSSSINYQEGVNIYYFKSDTGRIYSIYNNSDHNIGLRYSSERPALGVSFTYIMSLPAGESYNFIGNDKFYMSLTDSPEVSITYDFTGSMQGAIDNTVDVLTLQNLWDQIGFAVPMIGVSVLFVIGFIIFRKLSGGSSKGKVKF